MSDDRPTAGDQQNAELPHVDEVRAMEWSERGDAPERAVDDEGREFVVEWSSWTMRPILWPQMTEEEWASRCGVGEPCAGCGEKIGTRAIIVNDRTTDSVGHYHNRCFQQ